MRSTLNELRQSLSRNLSMSISLIVTMTVSLLLAALGLLILAQSDRTEKYYGDRLQLQVDLCTRNSPSANCIGGLTTKAQQASIEQALRENSQVKSFEERTPEEQYERSRVLYSQSDTGKKLLETLSPKSFPSTYFVTLNDPEKFDSVESQLSGMEGVGRVSSIKELLGPLFTFLDNLRNGALAISALLVVAAILQVSNTIRMTAYARRREIGIMRLVGASSWHIQLPFVLESMLAALISAALAAGGLAAFMQFVVYGYLRDTLSTTTTWVGWSDAFTVMGETTVLAVLLAMVPTLLLTRKYLDV
ncbi:FtsX-like permease family protein [Aeromicrobium sp. SMF47]|uniref:Cell division protein FtsX n=1 Tax=Aeromicrobium yanjiei TaxID=2662028 RepID=A0A5Q2MDM6_9ACTN|nr:MULTISPECIES: permease-like cell division protein FtsX [Aeromicrobium]MRJ78250.1 FtsX-like permease family protein [Aeromicrobium yanjiei]MRK03120.1 FtsX-like permease family protein [Aeromicrobium sp. S22]QGG40688.1 FtsX-like permease family protein [Aeromicrobium yanjiei]